MSEHVFDIQGEEDFRARVLEAPPDVAVVVDFWAEWCGPCRVLGPILEKAVESLGDKAVLAKVDTEENPELASTFGIRGIPAVKIFRGGELRDEFVGALSEAEVRAVLSGVVLSPADDLVKEGDLLLAKQETAEAEARFERALASVPDHPAASLRLARLALARGEPDRARELVGRAAEGGEENEEAEGLLARIKFLETSSSEGGREEIEKKLEASPDDLDVRFALGAVLAAEGDFREALDAYLAILERDRDFREGAARKAMVSIFSIVGQRSPLADEYRERMSRVLYS